MYVCCFVLLFEKQFILTLSSLLLVSLEAQITANTSKGTLSLPFPVKLEYSVLHLFKMNANSTVDEAWTNLYKTIEFWWEALPSHPVQGTRQEQSGFFQHCPDAGEKPCEYKHHPRFRMTFVGEDKAERGIITWNVFTEEIVQVGLEKKLCKRGDIYTIKTHALINNILAFLENCKPGIEMNHYGKHLVTTTSKITDWIDRPAVWYWCHRCGNGMGFSIKHICSFRIHGIVGEKKMNILHGGMQETVHLLVENGQYQTAMEVRDSIKQKHGQKLEYTPRQPFKESLKSNPKVSLCLASVLTIRMVLPSAGASEPLQRVVVFCYSRLMAHGRTSWILFD